MLKNRAVFFASFFALLISANSFALNDSSIKTKWGYTGQTGPDHWAQLNPHFSVCSIGKLQSPINIAPKITDKTSKLDIHYMPATMIIVDDGYTNLLIGKEQTIINDGHAIQLNFPESNTSEEILFNQDKYQLVQFHMHTPSENTLNGKSFPMEIHFVHQGKNGTLAVIGVFVKLGEENPTLQKIITNLPKEAHKPMQISGEEVSPLNLLPTDQKHYDFNGSLTTPPCAEGVQWIVMQNPITASAEQIAKLKAATHGANARPVQSRNKREIFYSE